MQIAGTRVQSLLACYGRKLAAARRQGAVSYTHLTLPTIYSV